MTTAHIKTLLSPPDVSLSEARALEYLESNFTSWDSLGPLSKLESEAERTRVEMHELNERVRSLGSKDAVLVLMWDSVA